MIAEATRLAREFLFPDTTRKAIPALDGGLMPNDRLERAPALGGPAIEAPDDLVVGPDGALYVSSGTRIVRCSGPGFAERAVVATLPGPAGALAVEPQGTLLVCVSGAGLCRVTDVDRFETVAAAAEGEALRSPTALAVAPDGTIHLADGSSAHLAEDWVWDLMEKRPRGRLVEIRGGQARVVARGLAWPSGLALSPDGRSLLVSEAWAHALHRRDVASGRTEVVASNLPGYPGRLSAAAAPGEHWLAVFALRTHLVDFVLTQDDFRAEMMRTIDPRWWIRPALRTLDSGLEPLQGGSIKKLGLTKPWAPPRSYGLAVRIAADGTPRESLHSRADGKRHGVTSVRADGRRLLVACKGGDAVVVAEAAA